MMLGSLSHRLFFSLVNTEPFPGVHVGGLGRIPYSESVWRNIDLLKGRRIISIMAVVHVIILLLAFYFNCIRWSSIELD